MENRKTIKINETKSWFSEKKKKKINHVGKPLVS